MPFISNLREREVRRTGTNVRESAWAWDTVFGLQAKRQGQRLVCLGSAKSPGDPSNILCGRLPIQSYQPWQGSLSIQV